MDLLNKQHFFDQISRHLSSQKGYISIVQDGKKFEKTFAATNKSNWSLHDVIKQSTSVELFIEQLTNYGFTNGAKILLRISEGKNPPRFRTINEADLTFSKLPETPQAEQNTPNNTETMQNTTSLQMGSTVQGMAYANIPQHELITMKVQEARYLDLVDKYKKAEDELSATKSELRIEKEKLGSAERKIITIEDKWEIKMDRALNDKKTFLDSDTGKEVIVALSGSLPQILTALKPAQPGIGMGNPLQGMSELRQAVFVQLKELPEPAISMLNSVGTLLMTVDGFSEELQSLINNATNS